MSSVEVSGSEGGVGAFTDFVYGFASAPGVLFASCASGLYRSVDEGRTWNDLSHRVRTTLQLADQIPITAVALSPDFEHDRTMFAAVGGILLRSSDAGEHWAASRLASP